MGDLLSYLDNLLVLTSYIYFSGKAPNSRGSRNLIKRRSIKSKCYGGNDIWWKKTQYIFSLQASTDGVYVVNEFELPFRFSLDGRESSYNEPCHSRLNAASLIQDTNGEGEYYIIVYSINFVMSSWQIVTQVVIGYTYISQWQLMLFFNWIEGWFCHHCLISNREGLGTSL